MALWKMTRMKIIKSALRKIGVVGQGESPTADQVAEAGEQLNAIIQHMPGSHQPLSKVQELVLNLSASSIVTVGGQNYKCIRGHISSTENQPGSGSQWKLLWETTDDTTGATTWATDTTYSAIGDIVLPETVIQIYSAYYRDAEKQDTPIDLIGFREHGSNPSKYDTGTSPVEAWVEKAVPLRMFLWPQAQATTDYTVIIKALVVMDDLVNANDTPETPRSYYNYLIYTLASDLAEEYGVPISERYWVEGKAEKYRKEVLNQETEDVDSRFVRGAF